MVRLKWDNEDFPMYQTGVSHGVFYGDDGVGHAWSGLISVTEKPQNNAPTAVYNAMGEKYDNFGNVAEKKHGLACYIYPEVMDEYLGYEFLEDFGFMVDERPPKKFHMAYRVELGNGLYEIHVLLNQIATFGETARQTIADSSVLSTITMNLEGAVDPRLGTSHIRLDSRLPLTKSAEVLLFGDQYTEPNINEFLTAEPIWETVATNYAPIIEPDYDNYVWLGGENLARTMYFVQRTIGGQMPDFEILTSTSSNTYMYVIPVKPGEVYSASRYGSLDKPQYRFGVAFSDVDVLNAQDMIKTFGGVGKSGNPKDTVLENIIVPEGAINMIFYIGRDIDFTTSFYKVERGPTATPWTPSPTDPDQKPRAHDPYPENYKPGVKRASEWFNNRTVPYYDELRKGLGVYTYTHTLFSTQSRARIMSSNGLEGSNFRVRSEMYIESPPKFPTNGDPGIVVRYNRVETRPPRVSTSVKHHYLDYDVSKTTAANTPYLDVSFWHGGAGGSDPIIFINPMVTRNNDLDFFDANSKPKNKGERYVRVKGIQADYTEYQQLRLRTTAKVKLSDITQYDFWLEAADSMLLSQNETFTFNGPQAVIDGDTFTIDDSIQGYAEG